MSKGAIGNFTAECEEGMLENIDISNLASVKQYLLEKGLTGMLKKGRWAGYDYGNISIRHENGILVSCSQTSSKLEVELADFALVLEYDSEKFLARYVGSKKPSSEILIHWSAYKASSEISAVIHAHIVDETYSDSETTPYYPPRILAFFEQNNLPITVERSKTVESGLEIKKLIEHIGYEKVIGMPNHDGGFGLLSVDRNIADACEKLGRTYEQLVNGIEF